MNNTKKSIAVDPRSIPWKRVSKGVYRKDILHDRKANQLLSLFKIEEGAKLTRHKHPEKEWVYVLEGLYEDEYGSVPKGMIKMNRKGSIHTSQSNRGCILLVLWCGKHISVA